MHHVQTQTSFILEQQLSPWSKNAQWLEQMCTLCSNLTPIISGERTIDRIKKSQGGKDFQISVITSVSKTATFYFSNKTPDRVWLAILQIGFLKLHQILFINSVHMMRFWSMSITKYTHGMNYWTRTMHMKR